MDLPTDTARYGSADIEASSTKYLWRDSFARSVVVDAEATPHQEEEQHDEEHHDDEHHHDEHHHDAHDHSHHDKHDHAHKKDAAHH
jgi:hypothetical protein